MVKRLFLVIIPASAAMILAVFWWVRPGSRSMPSPVAMAKPESTQPLTPEPGPVVIPNTIKGQILRGATQNLSPAEMAVLLRKLYGENPDGLFAALMAIGKESLETRRRVLPLLAEALILWPDAEGRYVFPVADAFVELDLPAAAEWGTAFLVKTGRSDLAASSLLGRYSEVSEERAIALIATLPEDARKDAMNSVAYHIALGDLNHLVQVCDNLDPRGISGFSKQLFERLGMERLDDAAAWLLASPEAERIPGAIAAISQALVINGGPQKAMAWADSLPGVNGEAQAITTIYAQWARESPENAIKDILTNYDGAPQLMADVFKGAAEHHGNGAAAQWDAACSLVNSSARAYAISALIEPLLITSGPVETRARIAALPPNSLEREAAELMLQAAYKQPQLVTQIETRFSTSK